MRRVFIIGVALTKFEKPGTKQGDYNDWAKEVILKALEDAKMTMDEVEQGIAGYAYGDSTCGQRAIYEVAMNGIPICNVNNNCATGSTALLLAKQFIEGGLNDCVLTVGFENMGAVVMHESKYPDWTYPLDKHAKLIYEITGKLKLPLTSYIFGNLALEHMEKYGTKEEHFVKIAYKNHKHSVNNPYAQFRKEYTMEEITNSRKLFGPLTKLQCCPTSDGAGAAILASEKFVRAHGLESQAVEILAMEMSTDTESTFKDRTLIKLAGFDLTQTAAERAYLKSGVFPADIQVMEIHDCFSSNELVTYEALGLCAVGKAGEFIDKGDNTYGGKHVINPSGGLISKGHPLGATGLAQCAELCWQLRGLADARQVPGAKLALQQNFGLGGAAVVAIYKLGFPELSDKTVQLDSVGEFISKL